MSEWKPKPTTAGIYICIDSTDLDIWRCPRLVAMRIEQDEIDRGVPCRSDAVWGPVPECPADLLKHPDKHPRAMAVLREIKNDELATVTRGRNMRHLLDSDASLDSMEF